MGAINAIGIIAGDVLNSMGLVALSFLNAIGIVTNGGNGTSLLPLGKPTNYWCSLSIHQLGVRLVLLPLSGS